MSEATTADEATASARRIADELASRSDAIMRESAEAHEAGNARLGVTLGFLVAVLDDRKRVLAEVERLKRRLNDAEEAIDIYAGSDAEATTEASELREKLAAALRTVATANQLRQEIVDARGEATTARAERDVYRGQADQLAGRVADLERRWHAIQGWTRSNLQTLDSAQRDWRQSSENAAKQAILRDLSRCLEHLTEPQPAPAPDRADGNEQ